MNRIYLHFSASVLFVDSISKHTYYLDALKTSNG